jgi:three-Cys-motif partner protein
MRKPHFDEIGYWSEIKLDIIREYAQAYSRIMNAQRSIQKYLYIDGFAGAGRHISKEFHLIDLNGDKVEQLRQLTRHNPHVHVYSGDANKILTESVFPRCKYSDYRRGLCLLDPYSLCVDWQVIKAAGQMKSIEIFFNFMLMDVNMNVLLRNPERVPAAQIMRMDKAWGDHSWRDVAYEKVPTLFGDSEQKTDNETLARAFRKRLHEVAGFAYVPEPIPMRNHQGSIVYYLYFASPNKTGASIVTSIFNKYRERGRLK